VSKASASLFVSVHYRSGEPPIEQFIPEVPTMYLHERYRMIRMNDPMGEIQRAIDKFKGKPKLSVKDFLSR